MNSCISSILFFLQENNSFTLHELDADPKFERIAGFLALGLGFAPKTNAWAGPDHWKYRKIKGRTEVMHEKSHYFLIMCIQTFISVLIL